MSAAALGLVVVHYHTPELARGAVGALLDVARADALRIRLVVVDNGSDDTGRATLHEAVAAAGGSLLEPGRNLGYAGGANLGLRHLLEREPDLTNLGVMNPDVVVERGCLRALVEALGAADVVGPQQYWDEGHRFLMPPGEPRAAWEDLLLTLGRHHPRFTHTARARWRRDAWRHWLATRPVPGEPSGAMLLFTRQTYERVGPFDERYQLFFEETDWLARARRAGATVRFVPAATAIHLYHQSSAREPAAREWFAHSAARFRRQRYGRAWAALLRRVERSAAVALALDVLPFVAEVDLPAERYWVEVSPSGAGYPAAAERYIGSPAAWRLPEDARRRHPDLVLGVRFVDARGRELVLARP